jgi:VanZ family protein
VTKKQRLIFVKYARLYQVVLERRFFVRYWLPVLVWMSLIFVGSTDLMSGSRTGRFLVPMLRFFFPHITPAGLQAVQFYVRRSGHCLEYAILALLIWRLVHHYRTKEMRPRLELQAFQAWLWTAAYAVSDEFHQSFYSSRFASKWDVALDTTAAAVALLVAWWIGRWRKWW